MIEVVGISFKDGGRVYYFDPTGLKLSVNDDVIVETERGFQYGTVVEGTSEKKKENLNLPLKMVIRIANKEDKERYLLNLEDAKKAFVDCERLIKKHGLSMKLIDASFTFEREQLIFHFLSDSRIDFRNLAKELAGIYKTRIELRQIGVRDKAKEVGGLGPCGRILCCTDFLINFDAVSINMAKNQNLSLNPNKINGACGRLLCCLTYENDVYEEQRKGLPDLGERVKYNGKEGKVVSLDILKQTYVILTDNDEYLTVDLNESNK
jgi:cell fate regulator YaaT (PSP1 superfamily)